MSVRQRWAAAIVGLLAVAGVVVALVVPRPGPAPHPSASSSRPAGATGGPSARPSPAVPLRPLIAAAHWLSTPQGFRLQVQPSRFGRLHAAMAPSRALVEALRASRPLPLRLSPTVRHSLRTQLLCHADFAPRKPFWDLETWRPDVGFRQTVLHLCNP